MKPVYQTIFGKPDGNCFAACIASILEMDLEEVPNFCKGDNPRWMFDLNEWLHQFGLGALTVSFHDEIPLTMGWCCVGGYGGPEGVMHEVVMKDMKMVHNPHEGWGELATIVDYTFIVVLDPGKYLLANALAEGVSARYHQMSEQCAKELSELVYQARA